MKALKSPLAKLVLSDPQAKAQLLRFMAQGNSQCNDAPVVIEVKDDNGKLLRLVPTYVPSAS